MKVTVVGTGHAQPVEGVYEPADLIELSVIGRVSG